MVLNIDLNLLPPNEEDMVIENEVINHTPSSQRLPAIQIRHQSEEDDDVMIISPRTFAQATEGSSRRQRPRLPEVIYDTSPPLPPYFNPCPTVEQAPAANSLGEETHKEEESETHDDDQLTCPICISPLTEPTATNCGHIFCKECIRSAIRIRKNCPICRRRQTLRNIFRIYI